MAMGQARKNKTGERLRVAWLVVRYARCRSCCILALAWSLGVQAISRYGTVRYHEAALGGPGVGIQRGLIIHKNYLFLGIVCITILHRIKTAIKPDAIR